MNNELNVTLYVKAGYTTHYTNMEQNKLIRLIRKIHKNANKTFNVERYAANN